MEPRRPQLSLIELHQLRWLLGGALAVVSAWTVFYMEVDALALLVLATLLVPVATLRPDWAARVPAWVHRLAFPFVVAAFVYDYYTTRQVLPAMIRLDLLLLIYRAVSLRRRREDLQLILLSLFLVVVAGVVTASLAFALQILVFTGCGLGMLLIITLTDAAGGDGDPAAGAPAWVNVEWGSLLRRVWAVLDWRIVGLGGVLFAGVLVVSGLLFLAIPRFELSSSFFLDRLMPKKSRTGFSEAVQFGQVVEIINDTSLALSVDVSDRALVPDEPYWRMLALDAYDQNGFRVSQEFRAEYRHARTRSAEYIGTGRFRRDSLDWVFYMEPGVSRYLPLLGPYRLLGFTEPTAIHQHENARVVSMTNDSSKMFPYRVEGMFPEATIPDPAFAERWRQPPPERQTAPGDDDLVATMMMEGGAFGREYYERMLVPPRFNDLSSLTEEELALLKSWVEEIGPPGDDDVAAFVNRASRWLAEQHGYSLSSHNPGEGDVLVRWMGSDLPGHCELFAGAMVLLTRAAGLPSRLITGFKGGTWNAATGAILIKNSDAHAWVEVFDLASESWLRVDPTPGSQTTSGQATGDVEMAGGGGLMQDSGWSARMNGLRIFWYRRIVSFDHGSQVEMMKLVKEELEAMVKELRDAVDKRLRQFVAWLREPWDVMRFTWISLIAGAVIAAVWAWRALGISIWLRTLRGADPVRREAGRWLRRLEREGLAERDEAMRAALLRLRYGRRDTWRDPRAWFRRARRLVRAGARKSGG